MSQEWTAMTAGDLGRAIGAGKIDAIELTEAFLDRIGSAPQASRIYAHVTADRALSGAKAAQARAQAGTRLGLLDGVPISWKDLIDQAGTPCEAGSALLAGRVPSVDAPAFANATAVGLVSLGKTHMSELAFSGLGLNPITATPPNVNDESAVPGGSSSGAGTSVAFGLAAAAIGSDTGGSVRIPSAWNDLVGLKTTHGRLPMAGTVPLCEAFDTLGPLARSVEDCALLLAAMAGEKPVELGGESLQGKRLLILETVAMEGLRAGPEAAFGDAVEAFGKAGAQIESAAIPEVAEAIDLAAILFTAEAYGIWRDVIEAAPEKMFPRILERFRSGGETKAADYVAAWRRLRQLRAIWEEKIAGYDAVIMPTCPILPPNAARLLEDNAYYVTENLLTLRNTRIGNMMDSPALTLPTGHASCGVSLLGKANGEGALLRLGAAAEAALR